MRAMNSRSPFIQHGIHGPKDKRSPILTLFFIWRLHKKPSHGYSLIKDIERMGTAKCQPSTVYALLAKLEKAGIVESHYGRGAEHMRKLYQTTEKGWKLLQEVKKTKIRGLWREFIEHLLA
jgi:DNA-binding PadR family transcriptional regulator